VIFGLVEKYAGRVKVAEINAAAAPRAMQRLGVRGTPTVIYFRRGREVERVVGFRGELFHQQTVDEVLLG
jgi:thioredoxin-like negative regulator of GroEL